MRFQHSPATVFRESFIISHWLWLSFFNGGEVGKAIRFHLEAIVSGLKALLNGCNIITDVQMVKAGISKALLKPLVGAVKCFISTPDVAAEAKQLNVTRSIVAMRRAVPYVNGGIAVIGNAPTALFEMIRLVRAGVAKPLLIVGVPVGFVAAEESKSALLKQEEVSFITNEGRKGGSPVAVAITNALLRLAIAKREALRASPKSLEEK